MKSKKPAVPPSKSKVTTATFTGVVNGRPRFRFGDEAAPRWLVELAQDSEVVDGDFLVNGRPMPVGTILNGND